MEQVLELVNALSGWALIALVWFSIWTLRKMANERPTVVITKTITKTVEKESDKCKCEKQLEDDTKVGMFECDEFDDESAKENGIECNGDLRNCENVFFCDCGDMVRPQDCYFDIEKQKLVCGACGEFRSSGNVVPVLNGIDDSPKNADVPTEQGEPETFTIGVDANEDAGENIDATKQDDTLTPLGKAYAEYCSECAKHGDVIMQYETWLVQLNLSEDEIAVLNEITVEPSENDMPNVVSDTTSNEIIIDEHVIADSENNNPIETATSIESEIPNNETEEPRPNDGNVQGGIPTDESGTPA